MSMFVLRLIGEIRDFLDSLDKGQKLMTAQLQTLQAQVAQTDTVIGSAITLLQGLAAQILALKDDPVAIAALATDLQGTTQALADAVAANTPSATT